MDKKDIREAVDRFVKKVNEALKDNNSGAEIKKAAYDLLDDMEIEYKIKVKEEK